MIRFCDYKNDFSSPESGVGFHYFNSNYADLHTHNYWEFFLITEGDLFQNINGVDVELSKGDLCIVRPKDVHVFLPKQEHRSQHINTMITETALSELLDTLGMDSYHALLNAPVCIKMKLTEAEFEVFNEIIELLYRYGQGLSVASLIKSFVLESVRTAYFHNAVSSDKAREDELPDWLTDLLSKMHSRNFISLPLKELVSEVAFSKVHIDRLFKAYMNESIGAYYNRIKLKYAAELLKTTNFTTLEISSNIGYSSLSHFTRIFQKHYGVSPKHYRSITAKGANAKSASAVSESSYWTRAKIAQGLRVSDKGLVTLGGSPYRTLGVNYFSLFLSCLNGQTETSVQGLRTLAKHGIEFVRFNCGVYYGKDLNAYFEDREKWFSHLDTLCREAEALRIGLLPSFFWHHETALDYFGETVSAYGDPNSKTVNFIKEYTAETASRLMRRRSVFGWEFGNEFNLQIDIPSANRKGELFKTEWAAECFRLFSDTIRELGDARMITSGNANLRACQFHQQLTRRETGDPAWIVDNRAQRRDVSAFLHPGMDAVQEHLYFFDPVNGEQTGFFKGADTTCNTLEEYLEFSLEMSHSLGRAYVVGEFGPPAGYRSEKYPDNAFGGFAEMAEIFAESGVPIALAWNYDPAEPKTEMSWDEKTPEGKFVLETLGALNAGAEE